MWFGWATVKWLACCLEAYQKNSRLDFFAKTNEGSSSFFVQGCFNNNGCFIVLEEYGRGGRCGSIVIPEERGEGWRHMAKSLVECKAERRGSSRGGGQKPYLAVPQLHQQSYKEALEVWETEEQGLGGAFIPLLRWTESLNMLVHPALGQLVLTMGSGLRVVAGQVCSKEGTTYSVIFRRWRLNCTT